MQSQYLIEKLKISLLYENVWNRKLHDDWQRQT